MIFAQIYKAFLFSKNYNDNILTDSLSPYSNFKETNEENINMCVEILMNEEKYSFKKFIATSYKILIINCKYYRSTNINTSFSDFYVPNTHFCFPYILIHKACNLTFKSLNNMLFGNPLYTKSPIGFKLFTDNIGPHSNEFLDPESFFFHDLTHFSLTYHNIKKYNMSDFYNILNIIRDDSFERRVLEIFFIIKIFETEENYEIDKLEIFDEYNKIFDIIIKLYDENDIIYVCNYLFSSIDIDKYIDNIEEFKMKFIEYKQKKSLLSKLLESLDKDEEFIISKYSEIDDYNETDNKRQVLDKIYKTFNRLNIFNDLEKAILCLVDKISLYVS